MRALRGYVWQIDADLLHVHLDIGSRVKVPSREGIDYGDTVYVLWDYTANGARDIWTEQQYHSADIIPFEHTHDLVYPIDRLDPEEFACEMDEEIGFGFGDFS